MKYMVRSMFDFVSQKASNERGIVRFVLPSYPSSVLVPLGLRLEEHFSRIVDRRVVIRYGIALGLGERWESGSTSEKQHYATIVEKGWLDPDSTLTGIRNVEKPNDVDCLVEILAGFEYISDQSSLRDFFHLDQRTIWNLIMERSFAGWLADCLGIGVEESGNEEALQRISDLLKSLCDYGLTDILGVSWFLEKSRLSDDLTLDDVLHSILSDLSSFSLPRMTGLARRSRPRQAVRRYFAAAQAFFSYGMFLDGPSREKTLKRIDDYQAGSSRDEMDEDTLGRFASPDDLLNALRTYVAVGSEEDRVRLYSADFVYIYDNVLSHKEKRTVVRRAVRSIQGVPPEVFLRALWLTLGEVKREVRARSALPAEELQGITFTSTLFRHDLESSDEGEDTSVPQTYLRQLLGGIDQFIEDNLELELGDRTNPVPVTVHSHLCPPEGSDGPDYSYSPSATPALRFQIVVSYQSGESHRSEFVWLLPSHHPSRVVVSLYAWANEQFSRSGDVLPMFVMPYVPEAFASHDEEAVGRVIDLALQSNRGLMVGLLDSCSEDMQRLVLCCSRLYQSLLRETKESGFFSALAKFDGLRQSLVEVYRRYLDHGEQDFTGPQLMKAFMMTSEGEYRNGDGLWSSFMKCAIATPLHPAVLDMLVHQHAYLCESFCADARRGLEASGGTGLLEKQWDRVAELARVQWPVFGTIKDADSVLDTNVRGRGYFHLVGLCDAPASANASLVQYDEDEDEEVADVELFRETRNSQLVKRVLLDFRLLFDYADDGMSVGAYCGDEIQPIIAGVDAYLSELLGGRTERPYSLRLTIISSGADDSAVMRWVNAWKDRWQESHLSEDREYYRHCRLAISYRVVAEGNTEHLAALLRELSLDIVFLTGFVGLGASRFEPFGQDQRLPESYRKFPILERSCCHVRGAGPDTQRDRILSNNQFALSSLHAEVMAHIRLGRAAAAKRYSILSQNDFRHWLKVIDAAHQACIWVACFDPSIDESIVRRQETPQIRGRDIIGFGTGVGPHGELNYTISTERFAMTDIRDKIARQVSTLLNHLGPEVAEAISRSLVQEASRIGGLSVVKATGPSQYVRDYIAYAVVRKILGHDPTAFCDEVVSLDAYQHWFDDADEGTRPDLMRIQARVVDGCFDIVVQVIECKLANQSEGYLEKARHQIESGLRQLCGHFRPDEGQYPKGTDDRPDERYWWMQLHRLIASRGSVNAADYEKSVLALEHLCEGHYSISWQAGVVALWTDVVNPTLESSSDWTFTFEEKHLEITVAAGSATLIQDVCIGGTHPTIFRNDSFMTYKFSGGSDIAVPENQAPPILPQQVPPGVSQGSEIPTEPHRLPARILLGSAGSGGRDVYWEYGHPDLPNRHILVFGSSGTGKTYTIQAILIELCKLRQNAIIVDYTNGFTRNQLEPATTAKLNPTQHVVRREPLSINPFRRQCDYVDEMEFQEDAATTAQRVSGVFSQVYQLGDQQKSALYSAIRDGVNAEGSALTIRGLIQRLEVTRSEGGPTGNSAASVISKIQPFADMNPFGQEDAQGWERLYNDPISRCHIIQLAGYARDAARLIVEFSLIDMYWYYRARGQKDSPKVIVLDEIQNLDHRLESPLGQFLTEGRKFGISLILATQTLSNLDRDQRDRLFQASHKLFFKPADTEVRSFATILSDATGIHAEEWVDRLSTLKRGECYSLGHALNETAGRLEVSKWFKIRVRALEDRI